MQTHEPDENALAKTPQQQTAGMKRAARAVNKIEALRLRRQGLSFEQIGARLGANPRTVADWVKRAVAEIPDEEAAQVRTIELERLDMLVAAHLGMAVRGNHKSADIVLRSMERRAKFLNLDRQVEAGLAQVGSLLDRLVLGDEPGEESD